MPNKIIGVAIMSNLFLPYRHFLTKYFYLNRNSGADSAILLVTNHIYILYLGNPNKIVLPQVVSEFGYAFKVAALKPCPALDEFGSASICRIAKFVRLFKIPMKRGRTTVLRTKFRGPTKLFVFGRS